MPKRWRVKAAANLDHFYDDLIAGEPAPRSEIDPEIATIATRLFRTGRQSAAPHAFKQQLWEELMQSSKVSAQSNLSGLHTRFAPAAVRQPAEQPPRTTWRGVPRLVLLQTAVAALLLLGLLATFRPGFDRGSSPEWSLNAPTFGSPAATPLVPAGELARPQDCTTHVLRLNEIAAMLASVTNNNQQYEGGQQRPTGPEYLSLQATEVTFNDDATVDSATAAEIEPVYNMYWACGSAGSVRQQYYLMTPSGIVRTLINSNGTPIWGNVVQLGVPPTPVPGAVYIPEITATQQLDDGRIAIRYQFQYQDGSESGPSTMIFRSIDGAWYIDEVQCGICG
jgi:hypothetical protein